MRQPESLRASASLVNSWKEIARYLGRGVRTVQRWERDLALPVHRPRGKQRSAVLAIPEELDYWIQNTPGRVLGEVVMMRAEEAPRAVLVRRKTECERAQVLRAENRELRTRSSLLLQQLLDCTRTQLDKASRLRISIQKMDDVGPELSDANDDAGRPILNERGSQPGSSRTATPAIARIRISHQRVLQ